MADELQTVETTDPEQALSLLKGPLKDLCRQQIDQDVDPEKLHQYLQIRKCELYYNGNQYIALDITSTDQIDFSTVGTPLSSNKENEDETGTYDYVINIVEGDGDKYVALLGNRAPNVKAVADDPDDPVCVDRARRADRLKDVLYAWWNVKDKHRLACLEQWLAGTFFGYSPFVSNGYKYGYRTEPTWDTQPQTVSPAGFRCRSCGELTPAASPMAMPDACSACGAPFSPDSFEPEQIAQVPVQGEPKRYENGRPELYIYDGKQVTTPFYSISLEDVPWLRLEVEEHRARLIQAYPKLRDKLLGTSGESGAAASSTGSFVREASSNLLGMMFKRKNQVTYQRYWLRPMMYELITNNDQARTLLAQQYPEGAKVVIIDDEVVDIQPERLDDVWSHGLPKIGQYVWGRPRAWNHVLIQDIINDTTNIGVETLERGVSWMLADPQTIDFNALRSRARRPAEIVPVKPGTTGLKDSLYNAPVSKMSEELVPFRDKVHEDAREISGIQKAVFGAEGPTASGTAAEYEGRRNQAMMQLSVPWDCLRSFLSKTLENGAKQIARHSVDAVVAPGSSERIDVADLAEGGWHYEVEETMPITPGQRADRLLFLLDKPNISGPLGLLDPSGIPVIYDLLGISGLHPPNAEAIEAIRETINQLLQEAPMQQPGPDGQPVTLPSIQPKWEYDPALAVAVTKAWALTAAGRKAPQENPQGYENVIAFGQAYEQQMIAQQAPPASESPGPPGHAQPAPSKQPVGPMPPQPQVPIE